MLSLATHTTHQLLLLLTSQFGVKQRQLLSLLVLYEMVLAGASCIYLFPSLLHFHFFPSLLHLPTITSTDHSISALASPFGVKQRQLLLLLLLLLSLLVIYGMVLPRHLV